jgi:hypothetical protein
LFEPPSQAYLFAQPDAPVKLDTELRPMLGHFEQAVTFATVLRRIGAVNQVSKTPFNSKKISTCTITGCTALGVRDQLLSLKLVLKLTCTKVGSPGRSIHMSIHVAGSEHTYRGDMLEFI